MGNWKIVNYPTECIMGNWKIVNYPTALCRLQTLPKISTNITQYCTPEDRLDRFSCNAQATNWTEAMKKMADNLNYFSDDRVRMAGKY